MPHDHASAQATCLQRRSSSYRLGGPANYIRSVQRRHTQMRHGQSVVADRRLPGWDQTYFRVCLPPRFFCHVSFSSAVSAAKMYLTYMGEGILSAVAADSMTTGACLFRTSSESRSRSAPLTSSSSLMCQPQHGRREVRQNEGPTVSSQFDADYRSSNVEAVN